MEAPNRWTDSTGGPPGAVRPPPPPPPARSPSALRITCEPSEWPSSRTRIAGLADLTDRTNAASLGPFCSAMRTPTAAARALSRGDAAPAPTVFES